MEHNPPHSIEMYRQRSYDNLHNGKSPCHNIHHMRLSYSYEQIQIPSLHRSLNNSDANSSIIPRNFKIHTPQAKYKPSISNPSASSQTHDNNNLIHYPFHKNRAILRKSANDIFYNNYMSPHTHINDNRIYFDMKNGGSTSSDNILGSSSVLRDSTSSSDTEIDPMIRTCENYRHSKRQMQLYEMTQAKRKERYSNVYEYSYKQNLNSIYEDSGSDS